MTATQLIFVKVFEKDILFQMLKYYLCFLIIKKKKVKILFNILLL